MVNKRNNRKKPAMALVIIIIVLSSLTFLVMSTVQVITRSHTKYTTGVSDGGAVNPNQSSGRFICYKDANGTLHQITVRYKNDGSLQTNTDLNKLDASGNCQFQIPNSAKQFEITLIGGGGGGAMPNATMEDVLVDTSGEDTINFGSTGAVIPQLFKRTSKYIGSQTNADNLVNDFFKNFRIKTIASDAPADNGVAGARGANCVFNVDNAVRVNSKIEYEQGDGDPSTNDFSQVKPRNGRSGTVSIMSYTNSGDALELTEHQQYIAHGGRSAVRINGSYMSPSSCTNSSYQSQDACMFMDVTNNKEPRINPYLYELNGTGKCNITNVLTGLSDKSTSRGATTPASSSLTTVNPASFSFSVVRDSKEYSIAPNQSFTFNMRHWTAKIYQAKAGEAGEVKTQVVPFLSSDGQQYIKIPAGNIGSGGKGATTKGGSGSAGTKTFLSINTSAGKFDLVAQGGKGGKADEQKTLEYYYGVPSDANIIMLQNFGGKNGVQANYVLSGDFGLTSFDSSVAISEQNAIKNSKPEKAELFGSSGASGSIIWGYPKMFDLASANARVDYNNDILTDSYTVPVAVGNYFTTTPSAGDGAYGAIIITW